MCVRACVYVMWTTVHKKKLKGEKKSHLTTGTTGVCVLLLADTLTHFWLSDSCTRSPTHVHSQVSLDREPKAHYSGHLAKLKEVKVCTWISVFRINVKKGREHTEANIGF